MANLIKKYMCKSDDSDYLGIIQNPSHLAIICEESGDRCTIHLSGKDAKDLMYFLISMYGSVADKVLYTNKESK